MCALRVFSALDCSFLQHKPVVHTIDTCCGGGLLGYLVFSITITKLNTS